MRDQEHLWNFYKNVGENRANHFRRNSDGKAGGKNVEYAVRFQSIYPRCVEEL